MKPHYIISFFLVPLLITGCAAVRPVTDIAAGAGGGALASDLSHGNVGITAAGAAGGLCARVARPARAAAGVAAARPEPA